MRHCFILFLFFLLQNSCTNTPEKPVVEKNSAIAPTKNEDVEPLTEQPAELPTDVPVFDTKSLRDKAAKLIQELRDSNDYAIRVGKDTLIDLNGDRYSDVLIEYYGSAGTGLKNAVHIYLYNNKTKRFIKEPVNLPNPTFYFRTNTVVSYYIGNGAGSAEEFRWNGLKLDTLETIEVDNWSMNHVFTSTAVIHNNVTKSRMIKISDMVWLPDRYNYWHYRPIIRREE